MGGLNCINPADQKATASLYELDERMENLIRISEVKMRNEVQQPSQDYFPQNQSFTNQGFED